MAKKMPLIISTLTLFASSLAPMATWADSPHSIDGPWSFEEMMAAEREVQPIIDEVCPYEYSVVDCAYRYTDERYQDDPIYNRLLLFEYYQFHVLSLNPNPKDGKVTIEYYFNPENSNEKYFSPIKTSTDGMGNIIKYFDGYSYIHTISELYIYQVENGYMSTPSNQNLYEEVFASPHTRMLYSGTKSAGESSLLPTNQAGTLEIEEYSYDPKYSDQLYVVFRDENGNMHPQAIIYSGCHQGGELCKLQYSRETPSPLLVNKPTYEEGYEDGYNDGLTAGYDEGYANGIAEGYDNGYSDGKNDGYESGFTDGINIGRDEGYDDGYDEGYTQGLDEGRFEGYEEGYMLGRDDGWMEGQDAGYHEGYDSGYSNGYDNGYSNGYNAARNQNDNTDENGSQDDKTDNTDNTGSITVDSTNLNRATNDGISVQNTSTINLDSGFVSNPKPKFSIKTPNTGSGVQENHSTEFPWWLGIVFALGILTLIWLFVPNRKKSHKKS